MGLFASCRTLGALNAAKRSFDRRKAEHALDYLFWEATLACNLTCRHCGSRCSPAEARESELGTAEAKRIFEEIAHDFDAREITIAVTGGEPLVRKDLFEIMSHARDLGFFWGLVTNGTLVTERTLREMERAGMGTVSISIDGDAEGHGVLRGAGAYERAMRGLSLLLEEGRFLECVQVTTVVHARNVGQLEALHDRFAGMGVGEWRLLMADPIGRMRDAENRELMLDRAGLERLLDFIAAKRAAGPMPITFEESGFLGLRYEGKVRDYYFHCPAGISVAGLLHDGAIGACPSLERNMVEGDARRERFAKVWETRFQRYRDRDGTRRCGPCGECQWWRYCEGGSLHLWDWDEGSTRLCHLKLLEGTGEPGLVGIGRSGR